VIRSYRGQWPKIASSAYVDQAATVIGDVTIGESSSVWPGAVIRGDVNVIRIGARTNIQDGAVLHVMREKFGLELGDSVTVGHGAVLHGCKIESRVLVGMGAIVLNGAHVGAGSIIGAGTLVLEGTMVPPGSLFLGHPGEFHRALTPQDLDGIDRYAARYVEYAETYKAGSAAEESRHQ
jgi:carbonic anhydrase/acetyltransferase-like protein (isoleucine patch superfamily)